MRKLTIQRPVIVGPMDAAAVDRIVEEAIERFEPLTHRDDEFERRFGKWRRPDNSPKYPIEIWVNTRINWHCGVNGVVDGVVDAVRFVKSFPESADRTLIGLICQFVVEEFEGNFATDDTLRKFRTNLLRRLDDVGY